MKKGSAMGRWSYFLESPCCVECIHHDSLIVILCWGEGGIIQGKVSIEEL